MGELFKVLSVYTESIQNAVQTLGSFLTAVRERMKALNDRFDEKTLQQLEEIMDVLSDLEFKNADLANRANILVVEILDTFLKLHSQS